MKGEFDVLDVEIFEVRYGEYIVKRKTRRAKEQLAELTTYIYSQGGVEFSENVFWVKSPKLTHVVNHLKEVLNIEFYEVKVKR